MSFINASDTPNKLQQKKQLKRQWRAVYFWPLVSGGQRAEDIGMGAGSTVCGLVITRMELYTIIFAVS